MRRMDILRRMSYTDEEVWMRGFFSKMVKYANSRLRDANVFTYTRSALSAAFTVSGRLRRMFVKE